MRPMIPRALPATREGQAGSVSLIALVSSLALVALAALSVDVGTFYYAKRKQQAATDLAAVVAARQIGQARLAVQQSLAANGVDPAALKTLEFGAYQADPRVTPAQRFQAADPASANAVRVTVASVAPMYFGSVFFPPALAAANAGQGVTIQTQAVATQADFASFAIGSQLASLNGGLLNAVLGGLLGGSLSLSVMDYQALATAQLDVFTLSRSLSTRIGLQGGSYGQLAAASVHLGDLLGAIADALRATGSSAAATAALAQVVAAFGPASTPVALGGLIDFGPLSPLPIGSDAPYSAKLTALDAMTMVAELAGRNHAVSVNLGGTLAGVASATLQLAVGEAAAHASFMTLGRLGATVQTAQMRLSLAAQVTAAAPLLSLRVPVTLQLASATASLASLACGPGPSTPAIGLDVQPSLADAWIGEMSPGAFSDFTQPADVQAATVASVLGIVGIYGRAHVAVGNTSPTRVAFSAADIAAGTKHRTTTTDFTAGLVESLAGGLQLSLTPGGVGLVPAPVALAVAQSLGRVAPVIDQSLADTLGVLGLELGNADTWITGLRCGGGVLVN